MLAPATDRALSCGRPVVLPSVDRQTPRVKQRAGRPPAMGSLAPNPKPGLAAQGYLELKSFRLGWRPELEGGQRTP